MPSPADLAAKGKKAMDASEYGQAVELFSEAIKQSPEAPDYYIKRSIAYQRTGEYQLALEDAEKGVFLGHKRGKRDVIAQAQLRRGISLQTLKRLGDSRVCLEEAKRLNDKDNTVSTWLKKVYSELEKVPEDDERRKETVKLIPDVHIEKAEPVVVQKAPPPAPPKEGVLTPLDKIRHEFFQTNTHVTFSLYVKGVPKDKATVDIKPTSLSLSFPMPSGSDFTFDLDPLFEEIDPVATSYSILSTKIEIRFAKKRPGVKWIAMERTGPAPASKAAESPAAEAPKVEKEEKKEAAPAYPTSSKKGPKDWDKLASELSGAKKDSKLGIDDPDDIEGDPVTALFKSIYATADDDTKRAMMKSYIESNGTALSTNWADVSKGKVETVPPEGVVAKDWNK